eukprot:1158469-Pelagomonas_calceolata.AAC.8
MILGSECLTVCLGMPVCSTSCKPETISRWKHPQAHANAHREQTNSNICAHAPAPSPRSSDMSAYARPGWHSRSFREAAHRPHPPLNLLREGKDGACGRRSSARLVPEVTAFRAGKQSPKQLRERCGRRNSARLIPEVIAFRTEEEASHHTQLRNWCGRGVLSGYSPEVTACTRQAELFPNKHRPSMLREREADACSENGNDRQWGHRNGKSQAQAGMGGGQHTLAFSAKRKGRSHRKA